MLSQEWLVLDTNIWIFGLRQHRNFPACKRLLQNLLRLRIKIPRQIVLELQNNLADYELKEFFRLLSSCPNQIKVHWEKAEVPRIQKYLRLGCRLGDAVICAHLEELGVGIFVSENRNFLKEIKEVPFRVISSEEAITEFLK